MRDAAPAEPTALELRLRLEHGQASPAEVLPILAAAALEAARVADTAADRRGVLAAIGRGFRTLWLLPLVHRRIGAADADLSPPITYDVTWTATPRQGAQLWLVAVQQ
jgi:hypothetical protein